jgi:hypothetical protein
LKKVRDFMMTLRKSRENSAFGEQMSKESSQTSGFRGVAIVDPFNSAYNSAECFGVAGTGW